MIHFKPTQEAILVCEDRTASMVGEHTRLVSIRDSTPCKNQWTLHVFDEFERRAEKLGASVEYLIYRCTVCGHRRIWGSLA